MTLHRLLPVLLAASCGSSPAEPSDHESELHTKIPELFAVTTVGGTGLGLQMAQDSTHVFWFHETGGYIVAAGPILSRSKLGLDPPQVLVADTWISNIFSRKFASDGGSFFWFDSTIYRVAKTGGAPIALTSSTAAGAVAAIAVDTQHLWFTNGAGLHRLSKSGGDPEMIAGGVTTALALDDRWVYFADDAQSAILRVSKSGGTAEVLVSASGVADIEVDATSIYWSQPNDGIVATAWKSWPGAPLVIADEEISGGDWMIGDIAVDLTKVYWQRPGTHRVVSVSKWGGFPQEIGRPNTAGFLLVDSTYVYWSEDAAIMRVRK